MQKLIMISMCLLFVGATAMADDIQPPWWRGLESTTLQGWEFLIPQATNINPDWPGPLDEGPPYKVGYLPSTEIIIVEPGPGMNWIDVDQASGRQGIWPLSGRMNIIVDNHKPPNPFKWVWVQIT